jgi:hypothetical protein
VEREEAITEAIRAQRSHGFKVKSWPVSTRRAPDEAFGTPGD